MSAPVDLAAIRARHARDERLCGADAIDRQQAQMHADRGALLAEVDALTRERDALNAVASRLLDNQAALAGVADEEVAEPIYRACGGDVGRHDCRTAAAAVLALLRARLAGP